MKDKKLEPRIIITGFSAETKGIVHEILAYLKPENLSGEHSPAYGAAKERIGKLFGHSDGREVTSPDGFSTIDDLRETANFFADTFTGKRGSTNIFEALKEAGLWTVQSRGRLEDAAKDIRDCCKAVGIELVTRRAGRG